MKVYAGPCPRSCLSVLTALLFSFLSPAHHAQEISLLLVSRVSLLCDLLVWWSSFREFPASPLLPRETLLCRQRASQVVVFFNSTPGRSQGGCAPVSVSEAASWTCSCSVLPGLPLGSEPCWRFLSSSPFEADGEALAHTCKRDLTAAPHSPPSPHVVVTIPVGW